VIDCSKELPAFFYQTSAGNEPVRDWILGLSPEARSSGEIFRKWNSAGPSECLIVAVSAKGSGRSEATFTKKTQKTPGRDLQVALRRMKEVL